MIADDIACVTVPRTPLETYLGQVDIHTGGYTPLAQGVVYDRQLRPIEFRCASCDDLHPWSERLRDAETGLYHGIECESAEYQRAQAERFAAAGHAAAASNALRARAGKARAAPGPATPAKRPRFVEAWER